MPLGRGKTSVLSDITVDADLDMGGSYQVADLASPASGEALRKGNKDIANAEIANAAAIAKTKLNLALALKNADIAADAAIAVSKLVNTYFPETLMTNIGDILIQGAANPRRLGIIAAGKYLKSTGSTYEGGSPINFVTGSYTGNAVDNRQITTGFICKLVLIAAQVASSVFHFLVMNVSGKQALAIRDENIVGRGVKPYLHAADGFVLGNIDEKANANGVAYKYVALG